MTNLWRKFWRSDIPIFLLIGLFTMNVWEDYGWMTIPGLLICAASAFAVVWLLEKLVDRRYRKEG